MLVEKYPLEKLREMLVDDWHPFPTVEEREGWKALPNAIVQSYITRGEQALDFDWPSLLAVPFLDYVRTGNRQRFQGVRNKRRDALANLVMAECMEGQGRFVDQISNGVWLTCEETYWGVPAHVRAQKAGRGLPDAAEPTVDLFAAETSALLAWTLYLVGNKLDDVSPMVRPRIALEVDRRILTPLLEREDFSWMGFQNTGRRVNNWNPWINSNWLLSFLLVENDTERRAQGVAKSLRCLDNFFEPYPRDGGCDEGPGYWGRAAGSLFDCLETLESATDGAIDVFDDQLLKNMGSFIYKLHIHDRYFVNFADASVLPTPAASILFRFGKKTGEENLMALGAWFAQDQKVAEIGFPADSVARQLPALFSVTDLLSAEFKQPLLADAWFPNIEVMGARSRKGSADGFFVAAKGGTNNESHNHNDVGNFVVFVDGKPLLIDTGVEPYTAKNSGPQRYDIWTMASDYHNLPQVNGYPQQPGGEYAGKDVMYDASDAEVTFRLDIADAYPAEAGLKSWIRSVVLDRAQEVRVEDVYDLEKEEEITLHLMTACDVEIIEGVVMLKEAALVDGRVSGTAQIHFDTDIFDASSEEISLVDGEKLHTIWGPRVVRIILQMKQPQQQGMCTLRITQ